MPKLKEANVPKLKETNEHKLKEADVPTLVKKCEKEVLEL